MAVWTPRSAAFRWGRPVEEPPLGPAVRAVAVGGGGVWAASRAGLARVDPETGAFRTVACRAPNARAVAVGPDGAVWVGSFRDGLCRFRPGAGERTWTARDGLASDVVYAVAVGPDGAVWVGSEGGLDRFEPESGTWSRVRLQRADTATTDRGVYALAVGRDGAVWAGTSVGLYRWDPPSDRLRLYGGGRLGAPAVHDVFVDAGGAVWAGTDAGLARVGRDGAVRRYGVRDGLPDAAVRSVAADARGRVWAGTTRGLVRLDPRAGAAVRYDRADGVPLDEFFAGRAARGPGGRLFFGGREGLVVVDPDRLPAAAPAAPVVVTGFEAFGLGGPPAAPWAARRLVVPPGYEDVALEYAALDYASGGKVRYAYRLDGVDGGWVHAGDRRYVTYANVAPGEYTFRVRATGPDGAWGPSEAALALVFEPHWWQTPWARALAVLAALAVGGALYRWRVAQAVELDRARRRIADDLHDDLGGRLAAIALEVEVASRDGRLPEAGRERLGAAAGAVRAAGADLRDAIWAVDPSGDTAAALAERMETVAHEALRAVPHRVELSDADGVPVPAEVRRAALLAFREALHNALRHGGGARVDVRVRATPHSVGFVVEDAGPGFDPAAAGAGGRGLRTMRERAEGVGGTLEVGPAAGGGTRVAFEAPVRAARGRWPRRRV